MKVVDIFAGPGGLVEGFSSMLQADGTRFFQVVTSVEMEKFAVQTLKLRSFLRLFDRDHLPSDYYSFLRDNISLEQLYDKHPMEYGLAEHSCWPVRLGPGGVSTEEVRQRIDDSLGKEDDFVLIGGPPCQAYSIAGRSRNKGIYGYDPEEDARQRLYIEYLQILADHSPVVFVMENVKGLLSSTLRNERLFFRILEDLQTPAAALQREGRQARKSPHYILHSLVQPKGLELAGLEGAVVHSEEHGVPQARHRVVLLGVREDVSSTQPGTLLPQVPVPLKRVLRSLPELRSGLSREGDSQDSWLSVLESQRGESWYRPANDMVDGLLEENLKKVKAFTFDRGAEFIPGRSPCIPADTWYHDKRMKGVANHATRGHIRGDLHRYFYAACFAAAHGRSPSLTDFPEALLPEHRSVEKVLREGSNFADRFRVQLWDRPSTTIMSHISKDGHYYIHPDPLQCRSSRHGTKTPHVV